MTVPDSQDQAPETRRPVVLTRHTRLAVVLIGFLLSLGLPVVVLSAPEPTVGRRVVDPRNDPAALGVTGALPDRVPGDPASIGRPGIPTPELPDGPLGIPGVALDAYQFAERTLAHARPGCHLSWSILAGIGRIESNHASDGRVDAFGNTLGPILGPRLDGTPGIAAIPDTDHGVLDQDTVWDRAVGPMQFIPTSWRSYGVDGNGDGVANPNNIYDSTIATGLYLCAGDANLSDLAQLQAAVFRYNHSVTYLSVVLQWAQAYLTGVIPTPSAPGSVPPGTNGHGGAPILPPGAPLAVAPPAAVVQSAPLELPAPTTSGSPSPPPVPTTAPSPTTTPLSPSPSPEPTPTLAVTPTPTETTPPAATPSPTESTPTPVTTTTPTPAVEATPTPSPSPVTTARSPSGPPSEHR